MLKTPICFLLSLMFVVFLGSSNTKAQQYTVTDLKTVAPYWNVSPSGVNSAGEVVGMFWGNGAPFAFRWTQATGMQSLGQGAAAFAVNDAGDIVGYVITSSGYFHAFLWNHDGTTQDLGTLGGNTSFASGINTAGYVVGNADVTGSSTTNAFLWTPQSGMQDLGTSTESAVAINESGEVVGILDSNEAFSWTESGGIRSLGAAAAYGINNFGVIVGAGSTSHAQLWQGRTITDLGTLGGTLSAAFGINQRGAVVGFSTISTSSNIDHAFIWTPTGGMQDLNLAVPASIQQKWVLQEATGINDAGQIAVYVVPATGNLIPHALLLSPQMFVTLSSSPHPSVVGQTVTFTARITSVVGPPPDGETVTFKSGATVLGTGTMQKGVAIFQTSSLSEGNHSMTATYAGDTNYLSSRSAVLIQVVNQ